MKKVYIILMVFILGFQLQVSAQADKVSMAATEDTLCNLADSMLRATFPDERIDFCYKFVAVLNRMLKEPNSYDYPFTKLSEKIHILSPADKSFKIFNWLISSEFVDTRYYGAIQMKDKNYKVYPLNDFSKQLDSDGAYKQLTNKEWFGAEYYSLEEKKLDNGKNIYVLLGKNNNNKSSSKKIIEILSFDEKGPYFGAPIFNIRNSGNTPFRFILEFQKGAQVTLNYDSNNKNLITFDKLISEANQPLRKNTLVPSGTIDALKWENGGFNYQENALPILNLKNGQAPINGVIPGSK